MPILVEAQNRLRAAFPSSSDLQLVQAIREAIDAADEAVKNGHPALATVMGRDLRGHMRRIMIAYQIQAYCARGDLPYKATMEPMPKGPWHWLEITAPGAKAHVCRTKDVFAFPEEAESRQDVRIALNGNLFTWQNQTPQTLEEVVKEVAELYAWLTYGVSSNGEIGHLCWASPAADDDSYIGHLNVLIEIARSGLAVPQTTPANLKDHLRLTDVAQAMIENATKANKKSA